MKPTIKDVANDAKVSIATVSHVINKTRYVSPDLKNRVKSSIKKIGYRFYPSEDSYNEIYNKIICLIVPDISNNMYASIGVSLENQLKQKEYDLLIITYNQDKSRALSYLNRLIKERKVSGIILSSYLFNSEDLSILVKSKIPFVFIDSIVKGIKANTVLSDNFGGVYNATTHLLKYGHERIALFQMSSNITTTEEEVQGYKKAITEHNIKFNKDLILSFREGEEELNNIIRKYMNSENRPTSIICTNSNFLTIIVKYLNEHGQNYPENLSLIGNNNYDFPSLIKPELTSISQFPDKIGTTALNILLRIISGEKIKNSIIRIPVKLNVKESTQIIGRGPFGEKSEYPDSLVLSDFEVGKINTGNYTAAIAFHYSGKTFIRLMELGTRDIFNKLNIKILSITNAHFDPNIQNRQLEGLMLLQPSVIISIPCDDIITAQSYKKIAKSNSKLILINNVPSGFKQSDYVTCVSVNERENGYNAGKLLGQYFDNKENIKIGLIVHGAEFYGTKQRDSAAEQVLREEFKNIEIVAKENFIKEERAYNICKEMIRVNPGIQGLYISWDGPALQSMKALSDLSREDVAIVTCDLDTEVAISIAKRGMIKGLSTERPYEQGVAVAYAAGNALLGKKVASFIGIKPYIVTSDNLVKVWKDVIKEREPDLLLKALEEFNY